MSQRTLFGAVTKNPVSIRAVTMTYFIALLMVLSNP
jgi:hypothetical protein